jgi:hypothetical protein
MLCHSTEGNKITALRYANVSRQFLEMPWLWGGPCYSSSGLVTGLSTWRIGFNAWLIHVGLVGDKVALSQGFSSSTSVSPLDYHPTHSLTYYLTINKLENDRLLNNTLKKL